MKWSMNWTLFRRSLAAGEFRTLLLALTIAIAALSSVGSITERVQHLLLGQANETLGADLVLRSDHEIAAPLSNAAQVQDLRVAKTATFPSMVGVHPQASAPVAAGEQHVAAASISAETEPAALTLASVKAVSDLYPLRGDLRLQDGTRTTAPQAGQALIDQRLQSMLGIEVGSILDVGLLQLRVVGILGQEPDAAFDFSSLQPRLMMNDADLAASGLLGFGSRVKYRLMLAGDAPALAEWRLQAAPQLERGQKLESVSDARPELKDALDRASRFLKLAALLAACLAAVAMILAARRFALRHYDMVALLRTFGATRRQVQQILLVQLALVAAMAALLGGVLGWLSQSALVALLKSSLPAPLPAGSSLPWLLASVLGLVLLLGCAGPMLMALAQTPPLRVLRREIEPSARVGLQWLVTAGLMLGLLYWIANDIQLALMVGAGVLLALALAGGLGLVLLRGLQRILPGATVKIALRQLQRQRVLVAAQLGALSLGLMGIALLTVVQSDLLSAWQRQIPANAPNHFAINIQPEQASAVAQQFSQQGLAAPTLLPMIRGRWLALNQQPVEPERYSEARAQRLAEREFNLSVAPSAVSEQGKIVAGQPLQANIPAWSVEEGLAKTLGIAVGDTLTFDVGGIPISAPVANLRQVAWESFQVNFFVMGSASLLQAQTGSWISSFYLPPNQTQWIASWVRAMPNITVIDVGQVLNEVQRVITLASSVLRLVLILCVLAGLTVLIAALDTTESERRREAAIMRALGATSKRLAAVWWVESLLLGAVAGLIAGGGASVLGWCLATQLLNIPMALNLLLPLYTILLGMFLAALTVWRRLRVFAQTTPMVLLKD